MCALKKDNWITFDTDLSSFTLKKYFSFTKKIKLIKIDIASMGWYNLYVNGFRIDKTVFSTGWTQYEKRVQYQHYEIKGRKFNSLKLKIVLGGGWCADKELAYVFKPRNNAPLYFNKSVNYQLTIIFEDDTKKIINTQEMDVFNNEIEYASIYNGEIQNALYEEKLLGKTKFVSYPSEIIPNEGEDIIYGEVFKPINMFKDHNDNLIIDFGQNLTGVIKIKIKGNKGDKISYTPGEILTKDNDFYNTNYRKAKSYYCFTLTGENDVFLPKFSFLGGRYIKLIEYPDNISINNFEAIMVHSKLDKTCEFSCGHDKLQRLYLNTYYSQLSNYLDIPTDCPQRDERLGWTADTQVFTKTAAIHFNVEKFFLKWLGDMRLNQDGEGGVNSIVPSFYNPFKIIASGWSDAATICPYEIYEAYGNKKVLKDNISMMENWINYLRNHQIKENIIELDFSFGDWLALDTIFTSSNYQGATTYSLISTAYYYYGVNILIKAKKILHQDVSMYIELLDKIKKAYQNEFIKDGHLIGERILFEKATEKDKSNYTQTGLALTLYFDLCQKEDKASLTNDLVNLIKDCDYKLTTGFLGTPYILQALAMNKRMDIAYKLLLSEEYPSWLYAINKGATTMWEHWDGVKKDGTLGPANMNSYNHYAYGSVFSFMFEYALGLRKSKPGYKGIIFEPKPNKDIKNMKASFKTKYGIIEASWECLDNDKITYYLSAPKGVGFKIIYNNKTRFIHNGSFKASVKETI